ncbi:MAG: nucleoside triphosphate pyrophosphohydrolase [Chloroflexota bacterium]
MTLDFARLGALLATLPPDLRPAGSCQLVDLAAPFEPDPTVPSLIVGLNGGAGDTASALARVRRGLRFDQTVWLMRADGSAHATTVDALTKDGALAGVEAIFVPPVEAETAERSLAGLRHIIYRLRAPGGCPWDQKQTRQSLAKYVLEEAYEVVDAIEHHGPEELSEELGDLLLQVFLQSELSEQDGGFTLNDVVERITTKLIRRHPHVFGDVQVSGASDVEVNWEALKKAEKGERVSALDGVPRSLPALTMAAEIQKRMKKAGYKWLDRQGVEAKLAEELRELQEAATPEEAAAELGDVLFVLTELASWHDATAEDALRGTIFRVEARFRYMEDRLRERGLAVSDVPIEELLALWGQAKTLNRQSA